MKHKAFNVRGLPRFTWEDLINIIDWSFNNQEAAKELEGEDFISALHLGMSREFAFSDKFYELLDKSPSIFQAVVIHNADTVPVKAGDKLAYIMDSFNPNARAQKELGCQVTTQASIYAGFVTNTLSHGKHNDTVNVFIMQLIGESEVHVWEDDKEYTYNFKEGDTVWIPAGLYHSVISKTPRAILSLACTEKDK